MTVHIRTLPMRNGGLIGVLALSAPERINAQNLAMVRQMQHALNTWRGTDEVQVVVLLGAGERGFCAGGDLKALHMAMSQPELLAEGETFFAEEYALCADIRRYPKPVLAWGEGIVMGGGWGLFAAASHRVVTATSKLAMPETAIGLFPDVAASWWLPQLAGCGTFLALTGAALNARDALWCGAAQWALAHDSRHLILQKIAGAALDADCSHALLSDVLSCEAEHQALALPAAQLAPNAALLQQVSEQTHWRQALQLCQALYTHADPWLRHAAVRLSKAAPTSLWLTWHLQQRCQTLEAAVAIETALSAACLRYGDFSAGIAATLLQRGSKPQWQVADMAALDSEELGAQFPMLFC